VADLAALKASLADRYTIERELGAGGMATVYLAHDVKHDRKVAIKVLKPELAAVLGAERFVQEIKTTAALSHPHILPLFDSGSADGQLYYVMPYIEGETIREKLNREGQFGIDEAVKITTEVADALDYAHRHGVIHRDIKPENILLHDGRPMVMDFGIALAVSAAAGGRMTETGLSLGTPHYMSPEQATADKEITGRSDIYSLASVLYEMLAGEPPHTGGSAQQVIMKIVAEEAQPVTKFRKSVPPNVAAAVAKALEKLPADRFDSAKAFADALGNPLFHTTAATGFAGALGGSAGHQSAWRWIAIGAVAVAVGAILFGWRASQRTPVAPVMRFSVSFPVNQAITPAATLRIALSRDGTRLVYVGPDPSGGTQLWIRGLASLASRPLPGTNGAYAPFFSPDGESVGYTTGTPGDLKIVSINGGTPRTIVRDSTMPWGGSWCGDAIYFSNGASHGATISDQGGRVETFSNPDASTGVSEHDWLRCIPGSDEILVQLWHTAFSDAQVALLDRNTGTVSPLIQAVTGQYLPSGYLLYVTSDGTMYRDKLDLKARRLAGKPVIVADGIQLDQTSGSAEFSASDNGVLAYLAGNTGGQHVVWVDSTGRQTPVDTSWKGTFDMVALSPDESRAGVEMIQNGGTEIAIKNLPHGPVTRISGLSESGGRPMWTPDGRWLAYTVTVGIPSPTSADTSAMHAVMIRRADGSAPADTLTLRGSVEEVAFLPDNLHYLIRIGSIAGKRDILLGSRGDTVRRPLVATPADEYAPTPSPDGKWFAYVSTESGHPEVYVRLIEHPDAGRTQISADGGTEPQWARSGREIFYRSRTGDMMAAAVHVVGNVLTSDPPRRLFSTTSMGTDPFHYAYSVSRDGRFLMVNQAPGAANLVVVVNWPATLKQR
jgi:eukaryotic-like serine/threonine-protein kinase